MFERRVTATEIRAEGRRLTGTVMRFGDVSPSHRERFEPGSLRLAEAVHLDLFHDVERAVAWHPGGGLTLTNGTDALTMRAELPPIPAADRALREVKAGTTTGLSVEFRALKERREAGIRVIQDAVLSGIGIVKSPSYGQSTVEARRRSGRTLQAEMPVESEADCECAGGLCNRVMVLQAAWDDMWREAFTEGTQRTVAAYLENYSTPLASTSRGTLRGSIRGIGFERRQPVVDIDIPDDDAGRRLLAAWDSAGLIVRPFVADIEGETAGGVQTIRKARLRAVIVSATDARNGWPAPVILPTPDDLDELAAADAPRTRQRRNRVWL